MLHFQVEGLLRARKATAISLCVGRYRGALIRRRGRVLRGTVFTPITAQVRQRGFISPKRVDLLPARSYFTVGIVYDGLLGKERGETLCQLPLTHSGLYMPSLSLINLL